MGDVAWRVGVVRLPANGAFLGAVRRCDAATAGGLFWDCFVCGALRGAVASAVGSSQALVTTAGQGASPAGSESSRHRGHGAACGGDGRGYVRDRRRPVRPRRRRSDRLRHRLLPLGVVFDADKVPAKRNLAAPETLPKKVETENSTRGVWRTIARAGTIVVGTAPRVGGTGPMD